jgi:cyclic beta-1,2-glucan synthetase
MFSSLTDGRVLSNGRYRLLLTASGTGFSAFDGLMLTRWHRDALADCGGVLLYLRDLDDGSVWSAGRQPIPPGRGARYRLQYRHGCVRIVRKEHEIESVCDAAVADSSPAEVRRLTLRNTSSRPRRIEVTTYLEVVLHYWGADAGHPGFSKLFVETGHDGGGAALWARRRPRSAEEKFPYLVHALHGDGPLQLETDRARFLGRGRTLERPLALEGRLSGTLGSVLDPVFSLRRVVQIEPGGEAVLTAVIATGDDKEATLALAASMRSPDEVNALFARAADAESSRARRFRLTRARAERLQRLGTALLYGDPLLGATTTPARTSTADGAHHGSADVARPPLEGASIAVHATHAELDNGAANALTAAARYWKELGLTIAWTLVCEDASCAGQHGCTLEILADRVRSDGVLASAVARAAAGDRAVEAVDTFAKVVVGAGDLAKLGADVSSLATARARKTRKSASPDEAEHSQPSATTATSTAGAEATVRTVFVLTTATGASLRTATSTA